MNIQQILAPIGLVAVAAALYSTAGTIQTGNVGIRTTLGIISQEEIEPGIYFKSTDLLVPEEYRGIGIRIEDDVLITDGDPVNLSAALPRTPDDVEAWLRAAQS